MRPGRGRAFDHRRRLDAAGAGEGIIVAPETSHAVKSAIDEALVCKKSGEAKTILFNCSGHGNFDMSAYDAFYAGQLVDYEYPDALIKESLARIPKIE